MAFTGGLITAIQKNMIGVFKQKAPAFTRTTTGYLDALKTPYNRNGVVFKMNEGVGGNKKRDCQIVIQKRWLEADTGTTLECSDEVVEDQFHDTVSIGDVYQTKWKTFSEVDLRDTAIGEAAFMRTGLLSMFDAATVGLNKQLLTLQAAGFGQWVGPLAAHSENWIYNNDELRLAGETSMMNLFEDSGGRGKPIIIGKDNLTQYWLRKMKGSASARGVDIAQLGDFVYHKDPNAQILGTDINGDSAACVLNAGMVHFVDAHNDYVGDGAKRAANVFEHGTVVDPQTNIKWDIAIEYKGATEACNPQWRIKIYKRYALYIPDAAKLWQVGDPLAPVNGSFKAEIMQQP